MDIEHKTGLILSGGGARAAYQAGVLQAISRILAEAGWPAARNPFAIVCGTSAGAINATGLACRADDFADAVESLCAIWHGIAAHQVYRADSIAVLRSGARWLSLLSFGWLLRSWHAAPPNSLLDNTPLAGLLHRMLDLPRLDAALEAERLDDVAARHTHDLPAPVRALLSGIGATEARGAALASYLLFEAGYTRELMALGRADTHARHDDVLEFFA